MIDAQKMMDAAGLGSAIGSPAAVVLDDTVSVEPISLALAKDHLRVSGDDDNAYILTLISTARQMAEARTNRTLVVRSRQAVFDSWGSALVLPQPPLRSVDRIAYLDEQGIEQTLAASDYVVNAHAEPARITLRYGSPSPRTAPQAMAITVDYTAGYTVVPGPIVQWMLLAIATMYNNRESVVNGVTSTALGDDFVRWLLQPYVVYE